MENLRYLLSKYNSSEPIYLGHRYKFYELNYMAGGPGYVLSKKALDLLVNRGLLHEKHCGFFLIPEDLGLGRCLQKIGIRGEDTRDEFGKERFFPFHPEYVLIPDGLPEWYWRYRFYKNSQV